MTARGAGYVGKNRREKDLIKCFVNDNANAVFLKQMIKRILFEISIVGVDFSLLMKSNDLIFHRVAVRTAEKLSKRTVHIININPSC